MNVHGIDLRCAVCKLAWAEYRCDWIETVQMKLGAWAIKQGDILLEWGPQTPKRYPVVAIISPVGAWRDVIVECPDGERICHRVKADFAILCERTGQCFTPVCEFHVRELSETRHICSNHWHSQLEAACCIRT